MNNRFFYTNVSESSHCCFEFTVVDSEKKGDGNHDKIVCECFDEGSAKLVTDALNKFKVDTIEMVK